MTNPCPPEPTPSKLNVDVEALGDAALVKSHSVTSDSETTVMRTGADLLDYARFVGGQASTGQQQCAVRNVFGMRMRPKQYQNKCS